MTTETKGIASAEVRSVVICDDIRQEDSGKFLFIGAYGPEINVPSFPGALILSFWHELQLRGPGEARVEYRVLIDHVEGNDSEQLEVASISGTASTTDEVDHSIFSLNGIRCDFDKPSILRTEVKINGGGWREVLRRTIKLRDDIDDGSQGEREDLESDSSS